MTSGDDEFHVKMEDVIVKQNNDLLALQEHLETKNRRLVILEEELQSQSAISQNLDDSISKQGSIIHVLNNDLKAKDSNIKEMHNEIIGLKKSLDETEESKMDLLKEIESLKKATGEKSSILEETKKWVVELQEELQTARERETEIRSNYTKETSKLKNDFSTQFKLFGEKSALIEAFYEQQIELLLNRVKLLSGNAHVLDFESSQKRYKEEINEIKSSISQFRESFLPTTFLNEVKEISSSLPQWLSLEAVLNLELKCKSEELENVKEELENVKAELLKAKETFTGILNHEKWLENNINEKDREIKCMQEEKLQLQRQLTAVNNKYEKATIDINIERSEIEKKYQQYLNSFESDMELLNKSLLFLNNNITNFLNPAIEVNFSECCFPASFDNDINLILNRDVLNAYHLAYNCLCEIESYCTKTKQVFKENNMLKTALDIEKKSLDEKVMHLKNVMDDLELIKNKYTYLEEEKKFLQNKFECLSDENKTYTINIEKLNAQILEFKKSMKNYQDEISSLKDEVNKLKEDSVQNELGTPERKWALLATSTPFDIMGAGDLPDSEHATVLKWMEKCQELNKEIILLTNQISDLESYNHNLKITINSVREDMGNFQEKQTALEEKLITYISLKKKYDVLIGEMELKDISIRKMSKELQNIEEKNIALSNKILELEELQKDNQSNYNFGNERVFSDTAIKSFSEKSSEIIKLKQEIYCLKKNEQNVTHQLDLLLEENGTYIEKLKQQSGKINLLQEELEKVEEEKLGLLAENKLLKKEIDLLELKVDYLSLLRDRKFNSSKLVEEMQADLVEMLRCCIRSPTNQGDGKDSEVGLQQIITGLGEELKGVRIDFLGKIERLQQFINAVEERGGVSEELLVGVDRLYRTIVEDQKHHAQNYSSLEKAITSLQVLQAKDKKFLMEDKITSMKTTVDVLKEEIKEKNTNIKTLLEQKDELELSLKDSKKRLCEIELKYERMVRAGEKERVLAQIQTSHKKVLKELEVECREGLQTSRLDEADAMHRKAVEEVRTLLKEELANMLLQQQLTHKQQVESLKQLITEQAIRIGLLLEQNADFAEGLEQDPGLLFHKEELHEELVRVLSSVRAAHAVEIDLVRLELSRPPPLLSNKCTCSSQGFSQEQADPSEDNTKILLALLEKILKEDYTNKLRNFLTSWHSSYSKYTEEIECSINSQIKQLKESDDSDSHLEVKINDNINHYNQIVSSALGFVEKVGNDYNFTLHKLKECVSMHIDVTKSCFKEIHSSHINTSEILKLQDEASVIKKEKDDLENRHRKAVSLMHVGVKELINAMEKLVEGESTANLQARLEEEHRHELDHLKDYYVQMCANLEKQYTEDVNSLHSKLSDQALSLDEDIPPVDTYSEKEWAVQQFSQEQMKFIKDLKCKWSDEINELKTNLENKYTKKMKDVHQVLSTYIYKNELDICARCLKDEVMRDCESEIEAIEKEVSMRVLKFQQKTTDSPTAGQASLVVKPQPSIFSSNIYLKNIFGQQTSCSAILSQFLSNIDSTLSNIDNKLKDKEYKLITIQNKFNSFSQFLFKFQGKCYNCNEFIQSYGSHLPIVKIIEDQLSNTKLSEAEIEKLYNIIKKNIHRNEGISEFSSKEPNNDEVVTKDNKKDLSSRDHDPNDLLEDYSQLIKERDGLKDMTATLKTAVSQLVMYLNTCEDELNKTVVDELIKICDESPTKDPVCSTPRRVHFAPQVESMDLQDSSFSLRVQLDSCLAKLKMEAASLLGLTSLHPPPVNLSKEIETLRKENQVLQQELSELKFHLDKCEHNHHLDRGEEVFGDDSSKIGTSILVDRVQNLLSGSDSASPKQTKLLDDLAKFGDRVIGDLQREKIDLQQQIIAADKRLQSTRSFLEEQAQERENERDEYSKVVMDLQERLKEIDRQSSSQELYSVQLQQLETQLAKTKAHLEEIEKGKEITESELKDAIEKIWVLRDIISDLEAQLDRKSEKEELLERKLDQLEEELDHHSDTQIAMAQELESLRGQSMEDSYLEQIKQLQENIKIQFDSSVVRNIKQQLQDMELSLEHRIKELENLYLTYSNNSLSSPSEEVSVAEQLGGRSQTPENSPSPVGLPVQELARLQEKVNRHATAEQVLLKRFRDLQLSCSKLTIQLEEVQAERDVIQQQMKKQMVQLAESNNKIDHLRHKVETAQMAANKDLVLEMQELKQKYSIADQEVINLEADLTELKNQLSHAEEIIGKQQTEMQMLADCNHREVQSLKLHLATVTKEKNKLENFAMQQKQEMNFDVISALLDDKNEDIEQLQMTVSHLQKQDVAEKQNSRNSKGNKVSFASDIQNSSSVMEDMRLRDASHQPSFHFESSKLLINDSSMNEYEKFGKHPELEESPIENVPPPQSISDSSNSAVEENFQLLLDKMKLESEEKSQQIADLEKKVEYLKSVQVDLKSTKSELQAVVSSVCEDKNYYESRLQSLTAEVKEKSEEIISLKQQIFKKDEDIHKKIADVKILEEISINLQEKLRQATHLAEQVDSNNLEAEFQQSVREIEHLKEELNAYKNDLSDEKELSETLKSSLNILTREKMQLEDKISLFETDNRNLSNALQAANDKLDQYSIAVRNLKNYLLSKHSSNISKETSLPSSPESNRSEENELRKLKEEVTKMAAINEQLYSERLMFIEEIDELKSTIFVEEARTNNMTVRQLQEELTELRKAVSQIKDEKLSVFSNFSSEIEQLNNDIESLQVSNQALGEKLRFNISEKQELHQMYTKLLQEKEDNKTSLEKQYSSGNKKELSFCDVNILNIPPTNSRSSLDNLAEKMRNEMKLSKSLDNSILETIKTGEKKGLVFGENSQNIQDPGTIKKALIEEVKRCEDVKRTLSDKIEKCQNLEVENSRLKLDISRLERVITNHNEKCNQLTKQIEQQKEKIINLELTVLREQSNLNQNKLLLEHERTKGRQTQKEDISLIETMRQRLQILMENEIKLKKLVLDEKTKSERLVAQINSVKALEKFHLDSNNKDSTNINDAFEDERSKYLALRIEYEKEKQSREDLQNVLTRERAVISVLKNNLSKSEQTQKEIEKEVSLLKKNLNEEVVRRRIAEAKIMELQDTFDSRFQKYFKEAEYKKQKELDSACAIIGELEREHGILMRKHSDLKLELREAQEGRGEVMERVRSLRETVADLGQERSWLLETVTALRERLAEKVNGRMEEKMIQEVEKKVRREVEGRVTREVEGRWEEEVDRLVRELLAVERQRKALAYQKEYLLITLRGIPRLRLSKPKRKISFRTVAWTVLAAIKLRRLQTYRLARYHRKKRLVIDKVKQSIFLHHLQVLPHSPPSKDYKH